MMGFGDAVASLDHMQTICTSLQTDIVAPTPHHSGQMLFLMPKQQWQSTEGNLLSPVSKHMVMCEECRATAWSISITHTSLTAPCPGLPG